MKKNGGIISHWQLHTLSPSPEQVREIRPDVQTERAHILTGTVVEDPTGRWQPGFHMKSSLVIRYDKEQGIVETENTIYRLQDPQGDTTLGGDLGDAVRSIFY